MLLTAQVLTHMALQVPWRVQQAPMKPPMKPVHYSCMFQTLRYSPALTTRPPHAYAPSLNQCKAIHCQTAIDHTAPLSAAQPCSLAASSPPRPFTRGTPSMKPVRRRMALRCCSFSRFSEAAGDTPVTENLCLASSSSSCRALRKQVFK